MMKFTRPSQQRVLVRQRLMDRLDTLRNFPVIWVYAPAGSGKTTLVSSYIAKRNLPCLWYQFDQGDTDIASFFYYLGRAAQNIITSMDRSFPLFMPECHPRLINFTQHFFEQLYSQFDEPHLFVFDNYHEVSLSAPMHDVFLQAVLNIPQGMNIIVISREEPPPNLIRLEIDQLVGFLKWDELCLNIEETEKFLCIHNKGEISPDTIQNIYHMTGGWAVGLFLIANIDRFEEYTAKQLFELSRDKLFAYFAFEVFRRLDDQTKDFFLTTAWFPKMTESMAVDLTENRLAKRILQRLSRSNFFILRKHINSELVYEYHQLYRDFLCAQAKEKLEPRNQRLVIIKAAQILERNGQVEEALGLILDTGDWGIMTQFFIQHGESILEQGRHHSLKKWLTAVPAEVLKKDPWLLYWMGMTTMHSNLIESMRYFEEAYTQFRDNDDIQGYFWTWSAMANIHAFGYREEEHIDQLIRDLQASMDGFNNILCEKDRAKVAGGMFRMLGMRKPEHPDIESWSDLALKLARKTGSADDETRIFLTRVYHLLAGGNLQTALKETEALPKVCQRTTLSQVGQLIIKTIEVVCYSCTFHHERCLAALEEGLELANKSGMHAWDVILMFHGVMSYINVGDEEGAAKYIMQISKHEDNSRPWLSILVHLVKSRYAVMLGLLDDAIISAHKALSMMGTNDSPLVACLVYIWYAQVLYLSGDEEQCDAIAVQAVPYITRLNNDGWLNPSFLQAHRLINSGRKEMGTEILRQALQRAREKGYYGPLLDVPTITAELCAQALEQGIETDYVKAIVRKRRIQPDDRFLALETWPWPVMIYTLGRFSIIQDGRPVISSRKKQHMPIILLKMLISLGGRNVRADQIADLLWPNADGDHAHLSFEATIHRLRRLLGFQDALLLREGRISLNARLCWVDTWAFEQLLRISDEVKTRGNMQEAIRLSEKAIGLYKGAYLGGDPDESWMFSARERLRSKFLRSVGWIAQQREGEGQWEYAAECYERCLDIDDCVEETYRRLMCCYQNIGKCGEALGVYRRCRRTLHVIFDVEPSPETQAIYHDLLVSPKALIPHPSVGIHKTQRIVHR